ncbi:hypothetical protein HDV00_001292 [Rhizophlyctis rosea]|nr:hypothetical protein HDV00_001292 [Rhizophlyctis rosea]
MANFSFEEGAKEAVQQLGALKIDTKIHAERISMCKIKIPSEIFPFVQADLALVGSQRDKASTTVQVFEPGVGGSGGVVRIASGEAKAVATLKKCVNAILGGRVLVDDKGNGVWCEWIGKSSGYAFLQEVMRSCGVFVYRDRRTRCLKVFGTEEERERARRMDFGAGIVGEIEGTAC